MRTANYFFICLLALGFAACSIEDPPPGPQMQYQNLQDALISFNQQQAVDLDQDGFDDLFFAFEPIDASSPIVGFTMRSFGRAEVYADKGDSIPALEPGTFIRENPQAPWHWDAESNLLCTFDYTNLDITSGWRGHWADAQNRFLGVRLRRGDLWYPGWIRMSVDTTVYQLILHDAAISVVPADLIEAGSY
ncbi:MAG: hypothetical protein IT270_12200 [Saprospiraceae bacterium]|nr:hypothetical protein [Saprospiraceae bacterium]